MDIQIDMSQLEKLGREFPKASASALNKVGASTRTLANRIIREEYNIKAGDLNKAMKLRRATGINLQAEIRVTGRRIPLIAFGARQAKAGVRVAVKRGERKVIKHAFLATMPSGHLGAFQRKPGDSPAGFVQRLPIKELTGPSIPTLLGSERILDRLRDFFTEKLPEVLQHEISFLQK